MVEVIYFFALFVPFQVPFIFVACYKKEALEGILNDDDDEELDDKEAQEEQRLKEAKTRRQEELKAFEEKKAKS